MPQPKVLVHWPAHVALAMWFFFAKAEFSERPCLPYFFNTFFSLVHEQELGQYPIFTLLEIQYCIIGYLIPRFGITEGYSPWV